MKTPSILIYGYGNPGRKDDGLGIYFAENMEKWTNKKGFENIHFDANYQPNPEDATTIAPHDIVLFADASLENIVDFAVEKVKVSGKMDFSLHSTAPGYLIYLCNNIYGRIPDAYLLHIKGYEWQLELGLTSGAAKNLEKALKFVQESFEESFIQNKEVVLNF